MEFLIMLPNNLPQEDISIEQMDTEGHRSIQSLFIKKFPEPHKKRVKKISYSELQ